MELYDFGNTANLNRLVDAYMVSLQKNRLTVATVEPCTDGMLSARLADILGVSEVFQEDHIVYSNKAKRRLLNVSKTTLKEYGAMGTRTVREMATSTIFAASVDIAVPITDIARPDGGDDEKPVGLVFVGYHMNDRVIVEEHHFQGDRTAVRTQAAQSALYLLRATILEGTKA